jgi:hypothetical protein
VLNYYFDALTAPDFFFAFFLFFPGLRHLCAGNLVASSVVGKLVFEKTSSHHLYYFGDRHIVLENMHVIKRDGRRVEVAFDKITARIKKLSYGLHPEHCDRYVFCRHTSRSSLLLLLLRSVYFKKARDDDV